MKNYKSIALYLWGAALIGIVYDRRRELYATGHTGLAVVGAAASLVLLYASVRLWKK
jgi:hypothetical protein